MLANFDVQGVKTSASKVPENTQVDKVDSKDSNLDESKQKSLQEDLERQYEAGLRRRDGRTVGLGL